MTGRRKVASCRLIRPVRYGLLSTGGNRRMQGIEVRAGKFALIKGMNLPPDAPRRLVPMTYCRGCRSSFVMRRHLLDSGLGGAGMFRCPGSPAARIGCIVLSDGQYRAPSCAAGYPVRSAAGRFRRRRPETVRLYRYLFIDLCYIWGCICYVRWELMAIYCGSRGRIWRMPAEERSCWTTAAPCES